MPEFISPQSPFKAEVAEFLEVSGARAQSEQILGSFADLTHRIAEALWDAVLPGSPGASLSWELLTLTLVLALALYVLGYLFPKDITHITLCNVGIFSLAYALNGNFRHHHVSFPYPRALELWLQSAGLHHTHHSYLEKHWDTNLGLVTSIWDRLMGTIYIPDKYETTPWGLLPEEQVRYTSLSGNLQSPIVEIYKFLRRRYFSQRSPSGSKHV